jgi:hypothetical protein
LDLHVGKSIPIVGELRAKGFARSAEFTQFRSADPGLTARPRTVKTRVRQDMASDEIHEVASL